MTENNSDSIFLKALVKNAILECVGLILLICGGLGKSGMGMPFIPFLENENLMSAMIIIGGTLVLWGNYQIISLILQRKKNNKS